MATQAEQLAELKSLNAQLGLPEDDGMPLTYEQKIQELRALDEELASTPESFSEYVERRKVEDSRSLGDKTAAFTESFMTGAGALASEGKKAISELFSGDVGLKEAKGVFQVGIKDFGRFAKTLGGAAMDNFYSDEDEMRREYERYKDNFLYNQNVRTAMLDTFDEKGRNFVSFGANFVDPTLLVPGAGLIAKGGSLGAKAVATGAKAGAFAARSPRLVQLSKAMAKTSRGADKVARGLDKASEVASIPGKLAASGTRKAIKGSALVGSKIAGGVGKAGELTSKVAALPRSAVTGLASKVIDPKIAGSGILGAQVTGALTGQVPGLGLLTGAEALGYIANKTGRGIERTLSALSSTSGQKRFLQRLATTADSPRLRKLALMAHAGGATKLTDLAFNSLVNGASVGALNGALAYAAGEGVEGVGAAVGSGTLIGGSLPFGQPGMKGGKSQAARDQTSINFLNAKLADDQIKQFQKLSPEARLAFATVEEAGIRGPKLAFLDKQTYLDLLRQDDPNLRQAPNAHYDMGDNTIYVNQDGNAGRSSKEAMDILTHELGHHFITQAIKDDPLFARKILEQYEAKPGEESFEFAFTTDSAGSPIDSIQLNADAKKISDGYDSIQSGDQSISVGMDANKLAQEIGAEQFAMMMVDNPNIFNTIEPSLRQKLLDGSRKVLTMFGAVDPYTGNPLDISISPILKRNKQVRNLYKNYIKQREKSIVDKVDLAEKGVAIKVRKGESADQAVERMFGAQGISLKDAGAFRINNRKIREKLSQILNRLDEQPEGPMSSERNPRSGKPQSIVGKELSSELRNVFTRNDPRGTINVLINDITESIKNRIQLNFLYRSGKPSKYSDNELRARVVSPVRFKVTGILAKGPKSAASLKMDAIDEAYLRNNVEVLVKEGFAKDPNKLIEQAREVARQALDDPEGRINPEGNYENELVTAVFGQPESAPQIRNAKLRQLLEDKKLQHAYRSYDVDALAGLVPTGKSGIAFDWFNIKNNYSPFDDKLFIPAYHGTPHTFSAEPGAPLGRFRTSAIGTGEGAQAYGHGLYFAGKREVAEHYRQALGYDPDKMKINGRQINDEYNRFAGNPKATNLDYQIAEGIERLMMNESPQDVISYFKENNFDPRAIKYFEDAKFETYGSLYKVELAPKENEYLLYDKTLGEQPKGVQDKLKKFLREQEGEDTWQYRKDQDYRDITNNVLEDMPEAEISRRLKEAGIPGIKYLDGSSRSKGEGDYNYVIFDEADVQITDKLFMPAEDVMTAVNVRNELNNKFADLIVSGQKSIETRRSRSLDNLIGNRVKIVRTTGKGDEARVIGEVTIGEPIQYRTRAEFAKDYDKHLVDEDSDFAFQDGGKFGYPMLNPERYNTPYPMPKRKGIVYTKEVGGPDKLFMPASEAGAGKGKQAEAAKLWQEKGEDSPYFKKWFGKSKVVDENGKPLVVKHGLASGELVDNFFDPDKLGRNTKAPSAMEGFFFSRGKTSESYGLKTLDYDSAKDLDYDVYSELLNTKEIFESLTGESFDDKIPGTFSSFDEGVLDPSSYFETGFSNNSPEDYVVDLQSKLKNTINDLEWESGSFQDDIKNQLEQEANRLRKNVLEPLEKVDDMAAANVAQVEAYLSLQDPLIVDQKGKEYRETTYYDIIAQAKRDGRDGVIIKNTYDGGPLDDIYVAFKPEQIKSATGNRGTFDAGERNILFMPTQGDTTPASVQSWDGPNPTFGTNFTKGMVKDNKEAAALLRKSYEDQFGEPLRAQDFTEEQVSWLGDMLAQEGEAALGRTGNAVDWYTSAVERALAVAEEIFPDIGQKYEAKDRFLGALSITSQNMRVMDNAKGAVKQYQHKERTGKFDYSIKHGAKADAITKNLKLYDQAEAKMGAKDLHEFLDTDFTVKELSEWGKGFFGDKKFSIAGYSTDMVKGSAIFGPKIGQGFFQNLRGNYNPVTVDLWLRRTFGRLTGLALDTQLKPGDIGRLIYSVRKNVGKRKFSGLELPEFLKGVAITGKVQGNGVANFKISDQAYNRLFGDNTIGRDNYEAVYEFAGKLNKEWERRFATAGNDVTKAKKAIKAAKKEKKGTANLEKKLAKLEIEKEAIGKEKPQWAKAGSTVSDKLKPIDIPSNAERAVITKAFNVALKTLRDKGIDLTPADLQATLWYPEKDIWAFLKGENSDALNMSYDTAMEVIRDQR
jgi:predicted transcriptional regulator